MTDTSIMQERISDLCYQFKLPTVGAETTPRFTAAGHGAALPTFLEVLEQEAEDRKSASHRPAAQDIQAALGQDLGDLRARPDALGTQAADGPTGPGQFRGYTASTCWPSDCPAPARPTPCVPWATA